MSHSGRSSRSESPRAVDAAREVAQCRLELALSRVGALRAPPSGRQRRIEKRMPDRSGPIAVQGDGGREAPNEGITRARRIYCIHPMAWILLPPVPIREQASASTQGYNHTANAVRTNLNSPVPRV